MNTPTSLGSAIVELEVEIDAPRERVWQGLTDEIGEWWPQEFFTTKSPRFTLEPRVGGHMYEDTGDGTGAIWFQVTAVRPLESMHLQGHIAPPFGGPATSLVTLALEERDGKTVFKLTDALFGVLPEKDRECLVKGWRQIFEGKFKSYFE